MIKSLAQIVLRTSDPSHEAVLGVMILLFTFGVVYIIIQVVRENTFWRIMFGLGLLGLIFSAFQQVP